MLNLVTLHFREKLQCKSLAARGLRSSREGPSAVSHPRPSLWRHRGNVVLTPALGLNCIPHVRLWQMSSYHLMNPFHWFNVFNLFIPFNLFNWLNPINQFNQFNPINLFNQFNPFNWFDCFNSFNWFNPFHLFDWFNRFNLFNWFNCPGKSMVERFRSVFSVNVLFCEVENVNVTETGGGHASVCLPAFPFCFFLVFGEGLVCMNSPGDPSATPKMAST